jgi:SOS-response transcriptional repressor LexA
MTATTWGGTSRLTRQKTRRDEIYEYICGYADTLNGPTPSIREISKAFDFSYPTAYHHVMRLIGEGRIIQDDKTRKLVVVGSEWIQPSSVR